MSSFYEAMRAAADDAVGAWTPGAALLAVDVHQDDDTPDRTHVTIELSNGELICRSWLSADAAVSREEAEFAVAAAVTISTGLAGAVEGPGGVVSTK